MAVFSITPLTNITEFINSDEVLPGDILLLEDGIYQQSVLVIKNYVKIVANGKCVFFDGGNTMTNGIYLYNVVGVEVLGLKFQNYTFSAIVISSGSSNRIIHNHSINGSIGIAISRSSGNLIYDNIIETASADGIRIMFTSTNNFVLKNKISNCGDDGIDCFFLEDANNLLVGNISRENADNGFEIFGTNCCAFENVAIANVGRGLYLNGGNIIALKNETCDNGIGIRATGDNCYVGINALTRNNGAGVDVFSNFNIIEQNDVQLNQNNGLTIGQQSYYNLVLRNCLARNVPANIVDNGTGNNFVENMVGKTSCESESEPSQNIPEKVITNMDDVSEKVQTEIEKQKELILRTEKAMSDDPNMQNQTQEFILGQMKEQLTKLTAYQENLLSVPTSEEAQKDTPSV